MFIVLFIIIHALIIINIFDDVFFFCLTVATEISSVLRFKDFNDFKDFKDFNDSNDLIDLSDI